MRSFVVGALKFAAHESACKLLKTPPTLVLSVGEILEVSALENSDVGRCVGAADTVCVRMDVRVEIKVECVSVVLLLLKLGATAEF